jgi:transposase-like protein
MEDYPRTLLDFEKRFATEEACREYLRRVRWPEGFRCPRCGLGEAWLTARGLHHCRGCSLETSLLAGTLFQDTKKPLVLWFRAMWHITTQKYGANALGLQRVLGFGTYRIAWTWLHKLRCAMVRPGRDRLSGTVEVDETYVGGEKPGKRGRGAAGKALVLIAAEEDGAGIGRIRLRRVANASAESLQPAVQAMVEAGSVVDTDGWSGYSGLGRRGYTHQVLRPAGDVGESLLPRVHRVAGLLKRWLLGTYQGAVRASHLDYYLDEYTFRFNRRTSRWRGKLFYRLAQQAVAVDPVPGRDILGHTWTPDAQGLGGT